MHAKELPNQDRKWVVPPTRPVKMRVSAFTA